MIANFRTGSSLPSNPNSLTPELYVSVNVHFAVLQFLYVEGEEEGYRRKRGGGEKEEEVKKEDEEGSSLSWVFWGRNELTHTCPLLTFSGCEPFP